MFLDLIVVHGFRPIELLRVPCRFLTYNGFLIVPGAKGSAARTVEVAKYGEPFLHHRSDCNCYPFPWSRSQIYTAARAMQLATAGSKRRSYNRVFSTLRAQYIQRMKQLTKDARMTADLVGHRAIQTQDHYL